MNNMCEYYNIETSDKKNTFFYYLKDFIPNSETKQVINWLNQMDDFIPSEGLDSDISRYQKWYQKDKKYFCNKWKKRFNKWKSFDYDDKLINFEKSILERINNLKLDIELPNINSCLINKYRSGNDHIKFHRDTHLTFGRYPIIINVSFGGNRILSFKNRNDLTREPEYNFNLENGSLFIMAGSSQESYYHGINQTSSNDLRYSFTFREVI